MRKLNQRKEKKAMAKLDITQLEQGTTIPDGSLYLVEMGDGSGTKAVTQETLAEETGKALKVGNLAELQTEEKGSLVAAINEAAQSGGGGAAVDILDSKEEIEANTETGKAAGALAVKEMFGALNDKVNGNILTYNESEDAYYIQHGADAVPKKLGNKGTIQCFNAPAVSGSQAGSYPFTFDLSSVCENYQNLTVADIAGGIKSVSTKTTSALIRSGSGSFGQIVNYNPKTGVIDATVNIGSQSGNVSVSVAPCFYVVT